MTRMRSSVNSAGENLTNKSGENKTSKKSKTYGFGEVFLNPIKTSFELPLTATFLC